MYDVNRTLKDLSFPCELIVKRDFDFMYKESKLICCGAGHYGCKKFKFIEGQVLILKEYIEDQYLDIFHKIKLESDGQEFYIHEKRLLIEIAQGILAFKEEKIQAKFSE